MKSLWKVSLDSLFVGIPALADRTLRWNGWLAEPHFPRSSVEMLIEAANASEEGMTMAWDGDLLVVSDPEWEEPEVYHPYILGGEQHWRVGAFGWTWTLPMATCGGCGKEYQPEKCGFEAHDCGGLPLPETIRFYRSGCSDDDCQYWVCEWCNSTGCQPCGWTGHSLDEDSGLPQRRED